MSLTPDSTLKEVFDFIYQEDHDVQVLPVTLSKEGDDHARLMILIHGKKKTANHIMANLMHAVQEMHNLATQEEEAHPELLLDSAAEELTDDVKDSVP